MGKCLGKVLLHSDVDSNCLSNSCDYCKTHVHAVRGQPELCYCVIPVSRLFKYVTKAVQRDIDTDSWMRDKSCYKCFTYDGMKVSYCQHPCVDSKCYELLNSTNDHEYNESRTLSVACNTRQKENNGFSCYSKMNETEVSLFPVTIIRCLTPHSCFVKKC